MQGEVVYEAPPYWKVVRRLDKQRQYDVIDTSVSPPRRVHGPTSQEDAKTFARLYSTTYLTLKGVFL